MADEEMLDKKAQKKAEKLAKQEEKERKREEKRRQKLEKAGASPEEIQQAMNYSVEYEDGGSRLAVFFVTVIIIAVWLAILALLVKMDVGGFGSTVLHPLLKDVPYINKILPEVEEENEGNIENTEYPYSTLEEAVARIKELEIALQNEKNAVADGQNRVAELEELALQLEAYKANEAAFEEMKQKFDEEVVFAEQAPDINEYKSYYESIDPENAEEIYRRVVEQQQNDAELTEYVNMYSSMKAKQAAAIFDTMTDDLDLVAKILQAMDAESSSDILGAMDTEVAAKLTKIMEPSE
ncbi:MAG: hypothetical protein J6A75_07160 [Lachnospiraceae bacterium]|nr:hypothetical protein [Lachnospiraceae bacterium]